MGTRSVRFALTVFPLVLVLLLVVSPVLAADATVSIDRVGGRTFSGDTVTRSLSGDVVVDGSFTPSSQDEPQPKPLVADAGNSGFTAQGGVVTLLGAGYGGAEPYTFRWYSPVGKIEGRDAPTAQLVTDGVAPGTYNVTLTVRDSAGKSATDRVKVVIFSGEPSVLLEETRNDPAPGTLVTGETLEFPFTVPAGTTSITVDATWTLPVNDYDLRILNPSGVEAAGSGNAPPAFESASVANPVAGSWTAVLDKYATVADDVTVKVTGTVASNDPRPVVDAGGPYRFEIGAAQRLIGTVTGGTAPYTVGWDTNLDGKLDKKGLRPAVNLAPGRHLVVFKATDAKGFERREVVSVLVANRERLAEETTAVTVIGIADSGINPYHLEFSAETYPDPDVLALTDNFTKHPSEYIPGYPATAEALPITLGQGYFPAQDSAIWTTDRITPGTLYWIPGTKIIGAVEAGGSTGATSGEDAHPILDDNGHGTGSASVSTGNRYGYCQTCVVVMVEALDETVTANMPWIDISSFSFGYVGGLPIGPVVGANEATRAAAERGQTILFAAGNGVGNAFDVPVSTYGSDQTGPDWNITVGAIRRDNERAIVGDGIPVHVSAWGDGNLPSACRTGTVGQCAFGGTSAATPYTAGIFGTVLTEIRQELGDGQAGQKDNQVVALGQPIVGSEYLADGQLTRQELRDAVLKTSFPLNTANEPSMFPFPATAPYTGDENVLFEGYGAATPAGAERAIDVLMGDAPMPFRPFEDRFFEMDRQIRDTIYGGYDRDGDGETDSFALDNSLDLGLTATALTTPEAVLTAMQKVAALSAPAVTEQLLGPNDQRFYLHRAFEAEPTAALSCLEDFNEQYMDMTNSAGDLEPCFDNRATSVVAAYRPVGIWASTTTLDAPLATGSKVTVELFMAGETPAVIMPTGVLMASDREIGEGSAAPAPVLGSGPGGAGCEALGDACWTKYTFAFDTTRPAVFGEQLTFQVQLIGARSWAFGYEGTHASRVSIQAAALPNDRSLDFGTTIHMPTSGEQFAEGEIVATAGRAFFPDMGAPDESGPQPTSNRIDVSVDDPSFGNPIEANYNPDSGWWGVRLVGLAPGNYTLYSRARMDSTVSDVASVSFTVNPAPVERQIQWQVVDDGAEPADGAWRSASVSEFTYRFTIRTGTYGAGDHDLIVRLLENGDAVATDRINVRFSGAGN